MTHYSWLPDRTSERVVYAPLDDDHSRDIRTVDVILWMDSMGGIDFRVVTDAIDEELDELAAGYEKVFDCLGLLHVHTLVGADTVEECRAEIEGLLADSL